MPSGQEDVLFFESLHRDIKNQCVRYSESGQPCGFKPCDSYIKLLSEKSRLEGLCAGLEEGNKINQECIKRQDEQLVELEAEVDRLAAKVDELQAPFRRHAASHDLGAPIRFSVDESRRIVGILRGEG